jgi:crotonobetainyl-CoA:carnitine CoA-transferase CaiB-like acyl-CoA transferase
VVQNDEQWQALVVELGSPEWATDPRFKTAGARKANEDDLDRLMAEFTRNEERYDLMNRLQKCGVPAGVVQNAADRCQRDPQLQQRGYFVPLPHSEIGTWPIEGFPAQFLKMPVAIGGRAGRAAPLMGEDNDYVYRQILGLTPEEIATLREDWII